jgi:oligo-1,6-glucosidase
MKNEMITMDSTMSTLMANPIGRDIVGRLTRYAGIDLHVVDNPLVGRVRLGSLPKLTGGMITEGLLQTLLTLFNSCEGEPLPGPSMERTWWKEAVVYQIYPRSFMDGNGDGIGDLPGVVQKLDYLKELGVDAVWLSPVFDSPNDDNGYDVRDYEAILEEFGTMEDMERLISGLHERGMKLIVDLVLNHTSDEHPWFQKSLSEPDGPYGDYYIWRDSLNTAAPPNNWASFFSGPAWRYFPQRRQWALHLFTEKQMDLNWDQPAVRAEVADIIRFWRGKGADGFRLDVINYISKTTFSDGDDTLGKLLGFPGVEHYFYGENLHNYLRQMKREAFGDAFTVGETPGTGPEMNKLLTAPAREELSTVFCFDHLENPGKNRFDEYRYDLNYLKECFISYEGAYADVAWPTIFIENHDNPRMVSKVDPRPCYRERIAKLLAVLLLTARGTVFLYQGQELGAVNVDFASIEELRDVESKNRYLELTRQGDPDPFGHVKNGTRDHARTPMQWTGGENAGFSTHTPWIRTGEAAAVNVEAEKNDPNSVLSAYRTLIALRKEHPALVYGGFHCLFPHRRNLFLYERQEGGDRFLVEANLSDGSMIPPGRREDVQRLFGNYPDASSKLRPYEVNLYRIHE